VIQKINWKADMPKYPSFKNCFLFIMISLLAVSCNNRKVTAEKEIDAKTPVTITGPVIKDVSEIIEFPSVTSYQAKNIIRSSTTGVVESVGVTQGENVNAGKLLFTVKTREAAALQNSNAVDSSLGFKGTIRIVSPKEGVVSTISHHTGDFVQEGDEMAAISDRNSLVFIIEVPFEMSKYIEKNRECSLRLPDNSVIKGSIKGILPEMNVQDQTVSYIVQPESNRQLPQNLIAVAGIKKDTRKNAQVLPKNAILGNETQTEFWVMKLINDSTAVKIPVKKGIENKDEVEITEPGFLPGDRILVTGNYGLPDTAAVVIKR
jgi:biotin carboxyl carrier protein/small nuclear ribonucleoprotein (snRNP)-like protein